MSNESPPKWLSWCYLALFALLPWSVEWPVGATWKLTVPAEPLIGIISIGVIIHFIRKRTLVLSWLGWAALAWLIWMNVSDLISGPLPGMWLVSWKYKTVATSHWVVFFGGLALWPQMWYRLVRIFSFSLAAVAVYTLVHHACYHFRVDQVMLAPLPFFPDNTIYSAVLALTLLGGVMPWLFRARPWQNGSDPLPFKLSTGIAVLFIMALCFAFSRAAWGSLLLTGFVGSALYFKKYVRWFLLVAVLGVMGGFVFREKISDRLRADVSSMERLNRYACSIRMAQDRPWTGFGPGTFQFQYLSYQKPDQMTRLSVTEPLARRGPDNYGRGGGAHSEYFQALAETGWPGLLCWLLLVTGSMAVGIRLYKLDDNIYWLMLTASLLSFFLHALVNNFLHDARVAALVWGQIAILNHALGNIRRAP